MKKIFSMLLFGFLSLSVSSQTAVSVAGFFPLPELVSRGSGRTVYNFTPVRDKDLLRKVPIA